MHKLEAGIATATVRFYQHVNYVLYPFLLSSSSFSGLRILLRL